MQKRSNRRSGFRAFCATWQSLACLLLLAAFVADAQAQSGPPALPRQRSSDEVNPLFIERRTVGDPRSRFELRFGAPGERCQTWRAEISSQPNGDAVFELKEPADKKVLRDLAYGERHVEYVVGDEQCNYRIRIERSK